MLHDFHGVFGLLDVFHWFSPFALRIELTSPASDIGLAGVISGPAKIIVLGITVQPQDLTDNELTSHGKYLT